VNLSRGSYRLQNKGDRRIHPFDQFKRAPEFGEVRFFGDDDFDVDFFLPGDPQELLVLFPKTPHSRHRGQFDIHADNVHSVDKRPQSLGENAVGLK
jgi:hypothetical protein